MANSLSRFSVISDTSVNGYVFSLFRPTFDAEVRAFQNREELIQLLSYVTNPILSGFMGAKKKTKKIRPDITLPVFLPDNTKVVYE